MATAARRTGRGLLLAAGVLCGVPPLAAGPLRITVLYDNTAARPDCRADWGFACLVEGAGKTILFDTGTRAETFRSNVEAVGVDLGRVGALVLSHLHLDHTGGLPFALEGRAGLAVYLPLGAPADLVDQLRLAQADVTVAEGSTSIGAHALVTGPVGGTTPEQALVLLRPHGLVVVTGCSHPGIVAIVEKVKRPGVRILAVVGGFHLRGHSDEAVAGIAARLQELGVERVGPTHCTGAQAIAAFRRAYGARFIEMGAGRIVDFP
jgi:7,8-dihydropterin-6-yl-methyl-4-(beta-D-ribofuranosyl)aminobenzene 5'-phosphate synthase